VAREIPEASVYETDFACPHCGAHAKQHWFEVYGQSISRASNRPFIPDIEAMKKHVLESDEERQALKEIHLPWAERMLKEQPFITQLKTYKSINVEFENVFVSQCFNCEELALWVHDRMIYPAVRSGAAPSVDLPPDILLDYDEARTILELSPRGAAALLRLAVQKLCAELGEKGKNIDDDIASLVAKGLDPVVQQALDAIRVIGNDAVHPGQIDLRDDREAALQLFDLINFITEQMIARPKKVAAMFGRIPASKQAAIAQRNAKAIAKGNGGP
jgi:hypothetical protein